MKGMKCKTMYLLMSFLHELLFFFINSFLLFPSRIKKIILCFVYSDDHQPTFVYPSLEEENLQPSYVVDVDPISSSQPVHKNEFCIQIPFEFNQSCNLEEVKTDSEPAQISIPFYIINLPYCWYQIHPTKL